LDVIISAQSLPEGWTASFTTSGSSESGNVILLEIGAFNYSEFTLILTAADDIVAGKDAIVEFSIEPLDSEVSTSHLKQTPKFIFSTACEGMDCIINSALDVESPQTIGLYVGIIVVIFLAVYRRGQSSAREFAVLEEEQKSLFAMDEALGEIPEAVVNEDDLEDDLELLDELEDL
jgi:hypothetical protein